eukprot:419697-Prorocentrum_minimum.AAC.1
MCPNVSKCEQEVVRVFGPALRSSRPDMEVNAGRNMSAARVGVRYTDPRSDGDVLLDCQVGDRTAISPITCKS